MINDRFKEFRQSQNLTIAKMASEINIKDYKVRDCEAGKQKFDDEFLSALSLKFENLNIKWLLTGQDSMFLNVAKQETNNEIITNSIRYRLQKKKSETLLTDSYQNTMSLLYKIFKSEQIDKVNCQDSLISFIKNFQINKITDYLKHNITSKSKDKAIAFMYDLEKDEIEFIIDNKELFAEIVKEEIHWYGKINLD